MVIQDYKVAPIEMSVIKTPNDEGRKYVIVKNHVRELPVEVDNDSPSIPAQENLKETYKIAPKSNKRIQANLQVECDQHCKTNAITISKTDLRDLRTIYKKCKSVLNRIEEKYGHLLNLEEDGPSDSTDNVTNFKECHCKVNKKIIFDENGEQVIQEVVLENHVCLKKFKHDVKEVPNESRNENIALEYEEESVSLPDDLKSLSHILRDSDIGITYRNRVIDKVKILKMENQNEIRFNRPALIEKLKSEPQNTEIFEFKGANLYALPGYPDWKKN